MTSSRGAEEDAHWHYPVEIIQPLSEIQRQLPGLLERPRDFSWNDDDLPDQVMGDDPLRIIDLLRNALADGAPPERLSKLVAYAAAMRLARFAKTNDVRDWFNPQHTFMFANAVHQTIRRSPTPGVVRGVFHAALAVYMDRFLNVPPAKLPDELGDLDDLPTEADALLSQLLRLLDKRSQSEPAARLVSRYLKLGHSPHSLFDVLAYATLREDLDFHTLQVLEAGVQQFVEWQGQPQAEHILIGVVRQLAAVCPTARTALRTATVARRLHRGEKLYEEETESS